MDTIKLIKIFKNINIDELIFDALILIIADVLGLFILNDKLFVFDKNTDAYLVGTVISTAVFFLFINVGAIFGRYKRYSKTHKLKSHFRPFIIVLIISFLNITSTILPDFAHFKI